MALPPYFVPRVPGLSHQSPGPADISESERRLRLVGAVGLAVLSVSVAAGLMLVEVGLMADGRLATLLAVAFGVSLAGGLATDLMSSLRRTPDESRLRPGLRPASFFYLAATLCMFAAFAFLAF